ncbi:hypothetical protein LPJ64_006145 [Coemansia asiatica]|uniref:Uncharacterized protein n=1 Tax=Coemansia asiatica TaxID=1052880 RepID=A0A9W8CFQ1_9FUNG|nr:hypothetical protein LPJ64_006145 [Coemansia asiatica]
MAEGANGQELAGVALAVSEAMAILQQNILERELDSASDQCGQVDLLDDENGMTREILGPEYDRDNLTASQVDFDQWMQMHASLESEKQNREPDQRPDLELGADYFEPNDYGEKEEEENNLQVDTDNARNSDIRSAWANAQSSWRSDSEVADNDDDPISIGSSSSSCSSNAEQEVNEYDSEQDVSQPYSDDNDDQQSVSLSETVDQEIDQRSAANAMLLFLSDSAAAAAAQQQEDSAGQPYERPPLPPLLAGHTQSSLAEMHKAINRSIERSLAIVDEITSDCEKTEYSVEASECEFSASEELEQHDVDMESGLFNQKGFSAEKEKLSAQILQLNTELSQAKCEKTELLERANVLENTNKEHMQQIDDLHRALDEKTSAYVQETAALKHRIKTIAEKAAGLSEKLDASTESLAETKQALKIADCERQDLISRCSGLGESIDLLNARLAKEMDKLGVVQNELRLARYGNASEARRLELESINSRLGQQCAELKTQLSLAHEKERLLLNTNRALEARLRDALRKENQPVTPEDILADHRRAWDQQLVEARAVAKQAREGLAACENELTRERRVNEQLRRRLEEMEASQRALEQSARKRKLQDEAGGSGEGAMENRWAIGDNSPATAARANALVTPTRPGMTEGKRRLLQASSGRFQQAVVDAGEYARERRRYRNAPSPLAERLPVTPRVNLQTQHQQHHVDVASLISPLRKSAR